MRFRDPFYVMGESCRSILQRERETMRFRDSFYVMGGNRRSVPVPKSGMVW